MDPNDNKLPRKDLHFLEQTYITRKINRTKPSHRQIKACPDILQEKRVDSTKVLPKALSLGNLVSHLGSKEPRCIELPD